MNIRDILIFIGTVIIVLSSTISAKAQRFAYIDSEYILGKMPEYKAAQKQLDVLAENWAKELDKMQQEIDKMYRNLQAELVLLTEEMKGQREKDIKQKEQELNDLRNKRFGFEGDLFTKRKELIKPIQDKIFEAVQKMSKEKSYDFVFDKGTQLLMLYDNGKFDKSDDILQMLGTTTSANKDTKISPKK